MKDSKFIELLNLYVDHQISAADAALLEAEIQHDPKRRQVYRQYCQMQKACVLLTDKFRTEAPAAEGQVIEFNPRRRRSTPLLYVTGLAAAAACVALVLVNRPQAESPASPSVAAAQPSIAPTMAAAAKPALPALQPVFRGIVHEDQAAAGTVATNDGSSFDWMTRVQFERVPAQGLSFDSVPATPVDDLVFRNRRVLDPQTEGAAFRFQK